MLVLLWIQVTLLVCGAFLPDKVITKIPYCTRVYFKESNSLLEILSPLSFHTYFSKQHIILLLVITDLESTMNFKLHHLGMCVFSNTHCGVLVLISSTFCNTLNRAQCCNCISQ